MTKCACVNNGTSSSSVGRYAIALQKILSKPAFSDHDDRTASPVHRDNKPLLLGTESEVLHVASAPIVVSSDASSDASSGAGSDVSRDTSSENWEPVTCLSRGDNLSALQSHGAMLTYGRSPWLPHFERLRWCATPSQGRFNARRAERSHRDATAPTAACCEPLAGGSHGRWVTPSKWRPAAGSCEVRQAAVTTRSELLDCLRGRVLLFDGDSTVRQLFLRLLWWVRDPSLGVVAEHGFHRHAVYTFDEHHDRFDILSRSRLSHSVANDDRPVQRLLHDEPSTEATLLYRFTGRKAKDYLETRDLGNATRSGRVAGIVRGYFGDFRVLTPRSDDTWCEDTLSLDTMNDSPGAAHYFERNRLVVGRTDSTTLPDPVPLMQNRHGWPQRKEQAIRFLRDQDAHFMCGLLDEWPGAISGWKMPMNGDCSDQLNLNAIHAMLAPICTCRQCRNTRKGV